MNFKQIICSILMLSFTCFAHSLIRINASTTAPKQGDAISLKITSAKPIKSASIKLGKTSFKLFKHQGSNQTFISYIGISRYSKAARRKIHFFIFVYGWITLPNLFTHLCKGCQLQKKNTLN